MEEPTYQEKKDAALVRAAVNHLMHQMCWSVCRGQRGSSRECKEQAEGVSKLRICKKLNIIMSTPLKDPGEGLRRCTQSQITSSLDVEGGEDELDVPVAAKQDATCL
jgi:hypothetical protein